MIWVVTGYNQSHLLGEIGLYYILVALSLIVTSAKIIQLNEWGYRDGMHYAKNHENKEIPY